MQAERIKYFAKKLQEEKQSLVKQITGLEQTGLSMALKESTGELSSYDNHPADMGDELFERSKDLALRDNAHILIEKVEHAFKKITDGTYGYCDKCNQQIPVERLEAVPWAGECIHCQQEDDDSDRVNRPIEESLLAVPFHRTFLDNDSDLSVGFDGEDALQAVMRYGSSDSPQDIPGSHDYKDLFLNDDEYQGIVDIVDAIPNPSNRRRPTKRK